MAGLPESVVQRAAACAAGLSRGAADARTAATTRRVLGLLRSAARTAATSSHSNTNGGTDECVPLLQQAIESAKADVGGTDA